MSETKIGKYTVLGEIGRGAMGIVYKATDPYIGRTVAVKTIRFDVLGQGPERDMAQKRFLREAHSAGNLSHPNIVTIYEVGEDQGLSYIAMEYIDGRSLEDLLNSRKKLKLDEVIALMEKIGDALETAHRKGIVHRDIKPANILLDGEGQPHLVDFGIARISTSTMTQTNMIMGTPFYMSPEQITGKKVDNRSDIFALGGVLYELLTGQKPFPGDSITTVIYKIMNEAPLPMRTFEKDLPEGLEVIVQKALAKDPEARYQSCRDLVRDLKNYSALETAKTLAHEGPLQDTGKGVPAVAPAGRKAKRPLLFLAGGLAALGIVVAAVLILSKKPEPTVAEKQDNAAVTGTQESSLPVSPPVSTPTPAEMLLQAQAYLKDEQWDKALEVLLRVPATAPEHYESRFQVAEIYRRTGRDADAEKAFQALIPLRRDDSRLYLRLAEIYDRANRRSEAVSFYQTYLSFRPKGPDAEQALKRLTALRKEEKERETAVALKQESQSKKPPESVPGEPKSQPVVRQSQGEEPTAATPKTKPEPPSPKPEEKALPASKPASLTEAQKAEARKLTEEGAQAINRKDYDRAVAKLEQALALNPADAEAKSHLAIARQKKAEKDAQVKLKKAKEELWYRRYEDALRLSRDVLALDPKNEDVKNIIPQALEGIRKNGPKQIEDLAKEYFRSVSKGDLTGFFQKNGTETLNRRVVRDMEVIASQYKDLKIVASGGRAFITDFQADEAQGIVKKMTGEATFKQTLSGVSKSGGGRQTLFDGEVLWRLEWKDGAWKVTDVVTTSSAK